MKYLSIPKSCKDKEAGDKGVFECKQLDMLEGGYKISMHSFRVGTTFECTGLKGGKYIHVVHYC